MFELLGVGKGDIHKAQELHTTTRIQSKIRKLVPRESLSRLLFFPIRIFSPVLERASRTFRGSSRLLFFPIWIVSLALELASRAFRRSTKLLFGEGDDEMDEHDERSPRRSPKRIRSRIRKLFPRAVWAVVFAILIGVSGLFLYRSTQDYNRKLAARYQVALAAAIEIGDDRQANLYRQKLMQLGVQTDSGAFQTAIAIAEKGDIAEAYNMMQKLASADSPGYQWAHLWQAQQLIDGNIRMPPSESLPLALNHLDQVKTRSGDLAQIEYLKGMAYFKMGRVDDAVNSLKNAAREMPVAYALLMQICSSNGDTESARSNANEIWAHLKRKKIDRKTLSSAELQWQMTAANLLGDPDKVAQSAGEWFDAYPDAPKARFNYALSLLRIVNAWLDDVDDRWEVKGELIPVQQLKEAADMMLDQEFDQVRATLARIWKMRNSSVKVKTFYNRILDVDDSQEEPVQLSGRAIEFFGTSAAAEGDWETADGLLAKATEADPTWGLAWNNRAFVLREAFPDRLDEAIGYADKAIELQPNDAEFRETRGMLLLKAERWEAAVPDLEMAVNGLVEQSKPIHLALAKAYENLGKKKLASVHENAAQ